MQTDQMIEPDLDLLPDFARCGVCGNHWEADGDMPVVVQEHGEPTALTDFIGRSLGEAHDTFMRCGQQGGVIYDLSPYILHWKKSTYDTVDWTYVIRSGDTGLALVTTYVHPECHADQ